MSDNPALTAASEASRRTGTAFLPLCILEDYMTAGDPVFQFGYPSRYFLARALPAFAQNFTRFALVAGKAIQYFQTLNQTYDLIIYVNDDVYVDFYTQVEKLQMAGITVLVSEDALSVPKDTRSGEGNLYSVFTPFKKAVWQKFIQNRPLPSADQKGVTYLPEVELARMSNQVSLTTDAIEKTFSTKRSLHIDGLVIDLSTLISLPTLGGWYVRESEAVALFKQYLEGGDLDTYQINRNSLELDAVGNGKTSKMSLALAWGLVSSRLLLASMQKHWGETFDNPFSTRVSQGALMYISELIWREFYRYQLYHHPELMETEFQKKFQGTIKWLEGEEAMTRFRAWIKGETGYPVVDAAMHQIAETGWMHNRSRMIVASILTKNLGVNWRWGQEYFRAALIDLDEASNCGGWQWGASVGADPKPIRIFNPELQAKNYDASGAYQDHWLGGSSLLRGTTVPLIEHKLARAEALKRYGLSATQPRDY